MIQRLGAVQAYLAQVQKTLRRGDATEHTYRSFLQELVQSLARGISCINEPKARDMTDFRSGKSDRVPSQMRRSHPDLMVALGETPLGFIETKDVGLDLAEIAESDQLKRYRKSLPNLILTDYLEFRWFRNGGQMDSVRLAAPGPKGSLRRTDDGEARLLTLFGNFLKAEVKTIGSPKELAARMAKLAQLVRRKIVEAFEAEAAGDELHSQLKAFRDVLLPDLDVPRFADMYAQTICYGLFAGKCNAEPGQVFARDNAASYLPRTNPFLKKLFSSIMAGDLNERVAGTIDAITFLLDHADVQAILADFGKRTRKEDPVVHFYETFLAEYDPKLRKSRGVYYTPEPVVSYIVRSVDWLLREKFGKKEGLADPSVLVLDPACGTGTFLYQVIKLIEERVKAKGQYGQWNTYVQTNLLPRIFGFELLMAPYAVAHLKLGLLLQETGYDFSGDERLGVYLTNTLEEAAKKSDILFAQWISDESNAASEIKKDKPVMVVLGNPPYSGHSANKGKWIQELVKDYFRVDGKPLGEKQPKWLHDDYVKFIRWSQWRLEKTGAGIHAYISNNGYLDNPTFRGMRQQLMRAFNELYILDLHGNAKKRETCPDGSKDENVFDIQQGVAIGIFLKSDRGMNLDVRHSSLYGSREGKYGMLSRAELKRSDWCNLTPSPPQYLLVPQDAKLQTEHEKGWRLDNVFQLGSVGVVTARDSLNIYFSTAELIDTLQMFANLTPEEARTQFSLGKDAQSWKVSWAQTDVREHRLQPQATSRMLYRPFDERVIFYTGTTNGLMARPIKRVMQHMLPRENLGLVCPKRVETPGGWCHVYSTRVLLDHVALSRKTIDTLFPLYAYPSVDKRVLFDADEPTDAPGGRRANLNPKFVAEMEQKLGLSFVPEQPEAVSRKPSAVSVFGPEDVFSYIYAVFHSPTYRKRYAEFLKIDFPRVPLTSDKKLFWKLVALGRELVALHLLESPKVNDFVTKYPVKGSDTVEKVWYVEPRTPSPQSSPARGEEAKRGRSSVPSPSMGEAKGEGEPGKVCINADQYFEGVKPEWFEFHIGGYQVLQKWLKDRKGRKLTNDDIRHYQRVVVAIRETIRLMGEIDKAIPKWPVE